MVKLPLPFKAGAISLTYGAVLQGVYTEKNPHAGVDFSNRALGVVAGVTIPASARGVVSFNGRSLASGPSYWAPSAAHGNCIEITYPDHWVKVRYSHREHIGPLRSGDPVDYGDDLGEIGDTGHADGAHLHMECWDMRTKKRVSPWGFFDPMSFVGDGKPAGGIVPEEEDDMFTDEDRRMVRAIYAAVFGPASVDAKELSWKEVDGAVKKAKYGILPIVIHNQTLIAQVPGKVNESKNA